jgi:hypothetical protein
MEQFVDRDLGQPSPRYLETKEALIRHIGAFQPSFGR